VVGGIQLQCAFIARHSRQARLDGMETQVASLGECMAAALAASWDAAHPLRMMSAQGSNIRLSFISSFGSQRDFQNLLTPL
jgi:hypothetical protein